MEASCTTHCDHKSSAPLAEHTQAEESRSFSVLVAAAASALDAKELTVEVAATCDADVSESQQRAAMLGMAPNTSDGASTKQVDENAKQDEVDLVQLILHDGPQQAASAEGRPGRPQQRSKRDLPACLSW